LALVVVLVVLAIAVGSNGAVTVKKGAKMV
jgi:hypothetical protein